MVNADLNTDSDRNDQDKGVKHEPSPEVILIKFKPLGYRKP
jgi:hypothetical protein